MSQFFSESNVVWLRRMPRGLEIKITNSLQIIQQGIRTTETVKSTVVKRYIKTFHLQRKNGAEKLFFRARLETCNDLGKQIFDF